MEIENLPPNEKKAVEGIVTQISQITEEQREALYNKLTIKQELQPLDKLVLIALKQFGYNHTSNVTRDAQQFKG